ncbi:uncharacterized protein LOC129746286 [Uranotaenia lowii]|uniref:uncharacterized protein LOC129746286 n=1 Tax=Uranotaenia lowii TaxID=190385 RepID=UPI002479B7E4|nr:uncharacterized protein LOC129746286 [Uranotaenia lowii]
MFGISNIPAQQRPLLAVNCPMVQNSIGSVSPTSVKPFNSKCLTVSADVQKKPPPAPASPMSEIGNGNSNVTNSDKKGEGGLNETVTAAATAGGNMMKWTSSNSSLSSVSDRKSTFYADIETKEDIVTGTTYDTMNDYSFSPTTVELRNPEVASSDADDRSVVMGGTLPLRGTTASLPSGVTSNKKRRPVSTLEGVISTKNHLNLVSHELDWERKLRDDQLSRILKALIYFEARLQNEHKLIKQQLHEKDDVISRQNSTIKRMKRKLGEDDDESDEVGLGDLPEVAQYCPKCRKSYYGTQYKCSATQTVVCKGVENVNTENLSLNSVEYASSSEEQDSSMYVLRANSFKDARRSRKYTSKRSYQGYSRPSRTSSMKSTTSSSGTGGGPMAAVIEGKTVTGSSVEMECNETYENIEPNTNVPKVVIYENYESDKENKGLVGESRNYETVEPSYSNRIDSMHGIRSGLRIVEDDAKEKLLTSEDDNRTEDGERRNTNQQKYTEGMEMKQAIETSDDWYASASDMEDSDSALGKPYSNAAVNPVLECVNQILLQQSMDGFGENKENSNNNEDDLYIKAQEPPKEPSQIRSKRVHFSTQNSMVQVPRIILQPTPVPRKEDKTSPTYEIQSIYSNEYEPIGSEQNSYSNYYVDMESKLGSEDRERELAAAEKRKIPPALPPKPANLMKLQQISKQRMVQIKAKSSSGASDIAESEPDYCSISEIQDSVKCVQIVAEIHKDACDDDYSVVDVVEMEETASKKSDPEESFADVPKLPNVAEIVPPKKESLTKFISQDNYITKSNGGTPTKSTPSKKDGQFREQLSEIIAEINKQSPAIRNASKKHVPVKDLSMGLKTMGSIPAPGFQSKLKSAERMNFLSKMNSESVPSIALKPNLNGSLPKPQVRPISIRSSLQNKSMTTNFNSNGVLNSLKTSSPHKSGSIISSLKSPGSQSNGSSPKTSPSKKTSVPVIIAEDSKLPLQAEFDWYNLDAEFGKANQPDIIIEADPAASPEPEGTPEDKPKDDSINGHGSEASGSDLENVEYNLDEAYKTMGPIVPPPDIIQKNSLVPPGTPINGKISYNNLSFKELMAMNETPKIEKMKSSSVDAANGNYEHFLDDSGLCSKPIILPRKKRVYYSGPFV